MSDETRSDPPRRIYRHRVSTRLWHWINAVVLTVMLMSGLMIFNAHPRLYWGQYGANTDRAWLQIGPTATGGQMVIGSTRIPTTGVLGRWTDRDGVERTRAFPWWATIPSGYSLAAARRWHLSVAWIFAVLTLAYLLWSAVNRHIRRDLLPTRAELTPASIGKDVVDHLRLRFHPTDGSAHYNVLQKLTYGLVLFVLLPVVILTGVSMSPGFNAAWPWMLDLFGGRQSARSLHFLCTAGLLGFIVVHLVLVLLAGPVNEIRSMVTGWFHVAQVKEGGA
ncbi:MAG TPA: cytochrome b/b6 domain-containing protein [Sphingomonas sp.]|jgi:thiosulfate reductase cytochrome b subunit|uniref:cytochrome b/b6 domain-containing protein n=1 Tax=Sphingomonas sp. TaxID=28214 RepID=UPI002EDB6172